MTNRFARRPWRAIRSARAIGRSPRPRPCKSRPSAVKAAGCRRRGWCAWPARRSTGSMPAMPLGLSAAWWVFRKAGIRQRYAAAVVAALLIGYALLTGGRPRALRAAVMVGAACAGLMLRRRTLPANAFALAWLIVALANPADIFTAGCQLSFLAVAVLRWGTRPFVQEFPEVPTTWTACRVFWLQRFLNPNLDPLEQLIEESRPSWQQ